MHAAEALIPTPDHLSYPCSLLIFLINMSRQMVIPQGYFFFAAAAEVRRLLRLTEAHYVMESLRKLTFALLLRDL